MIRTTMLTLILLAGTVLAGCSQNETEATKTQSTEASAVARVVTADIQAGIERYIAEKSQSGDGYFELPYEDGTLRMKLVRVHTEYLANLGPKKHFACVDLVTVEGDIYDVDFFMAGDAGDMTITETTVHKHNGQPFYTWEQNDKKVWDRVAMEDASPGHLGVIYGNDTFEFVYRTTLPALADNARMWLPVLKSDSFQTVELVSLNTPGNHSFITDEEHGNKVLFMELEPGDSGKTVEVRYNVQRREKACYPVSGNDQTKFLHPDGKVADSDPFRIEAVKVVTGKDSDLIKARALYDHVIDKMSYIKFGDGWGQGDAVHACDSGIGNCTDFHSYFIELARAVDIPARFAIGASIPSSRDEGRISGYHCWAEFYADGKWWPVDISEADKYSSLSTYYFGHHPANRVEFSRGRNLMLEPGPSSGSINFLAYPVLEVAGQPVKAAVEFSFVRAESDGMKES